MHGRWVRERSEWITRPHICWVGAIWSLAVCPLSPTHTLTGAIGHQDRKGRLNPLPDCEPLVLLLNVNQPLTLTPPSRRCNAASHVLAVTLFCICTSCASLTQRSKTMTKVRLRVGAPLWAHVVNDPYYPSASVLTCLFIWFAFYSCWSQCSKCWSDSQQRPEYDFGKCRRVRARRGRNGH